MNEFAKGSNISVTFPQHTGSVGVPNADGGLVSYFSSFGPSNEVLFKPAISAPGGENASVIASPCACLDIDIQETLLVPGPLLVARGLSTRALQWRLRSCVELPHAVPVLANEIPADGWCSRTRAAD